MFVYRIYIMSYFKKIILIFIKNPLNIFLYQRRFLRIETFGESMEPNFFPGEFYLVKRNFNPNLFERFDIVVMHCEKHNSIHLKRIVGMVNEKICYRKGILYINEKKFLEKNVIHNKQINVSIILGEDECFVMSDNRENYNFNCDSINTGPIKIEHVIGKVIT